MSYNVPSAKINTVNSVKFTGNSQVKNTTNTTSVSIKKDGDVKLKKALIGLGVIAAAGVGLYAAHKTGKLQGVKEFAGKAKNKVVSAIKSHGKKGVKVASNAAEASLKPVSGIASEPQDAVIKGKKAITDIVADKQTYANQESTVKGLKEQMEAMKKQLSELESNGGKEKQINKLKGHIGNLKGEIKKQEAVLKKLNNPSNEELSGVVNELKSSAAKSKEQQAVIAMQRAARKHPGLSDETLQKYYNSIVASPSVTARQQRIAELKEKLIVKR